MSIIQNEALVSAELFSLRDYGREVETTRWQPAEACETGHVTVIAPGWGETTSTLGKAARQLCQLGDTVYTFNHHRSMKAWSDPEGYKSATLGLVVEEAAQREAKTLSVFGHSEGAISTIGLLRDSDAARMAVSESTLVAPAGYIGLDSPWKLLNRGGMELLKNFKSFNGEYARNAFLFGDYARRNPLLNFQEIAAVANTDLVPDTKALLEDGQKIGIVACERDELFPIDKIEAQVKPLRRKNKYPNFHFARIDANHTEFIAKPEVVEAMCTVRATLGQTALKKLVRL